MYSRIGLLESGNICVKGHLYKSLVPEARKCKNLVVGPRRRFIQYRYCIFNIKTNAVWYLGQIESSKDQVGYKKDHYNRPCLAQKVI